MSQPVCSVIIVTHNSKKFLNRAISALQKQTREIDYTVIVDSGSKDTSYLLDYKDRKIQVVLEKENLGFCRASNIGAAKVFSWSDYLFFLNPDVFLTENFVAGALTIMESAENSQMGCLTGKLLGYDIDKNKPTGKIDTTGIFQKWYGHWYDRGRGQEDRPLFDLKKEEVPAICGAAMFCRKTALQSVLIKNLQVFDETFFMYKEDIDLSLRLRKAGWVLVYSPRLVAYHCRDWPLKRSQISRKFRLISARNEIHMHWKEHSIYVIYSLMKYLSVLFFNL